VSRSVAGDQDDVELQGLVAGEMAGKQTRRRWRMSGKAGSVNNVEICG
jgi:hypothetical protein